MKCENRQNDGSGSSSVNFLCIRWHRNHVCTFKEWQFFENQELLIKDNWCNFFQWNEKTNIDGSANDAFICLVLTSLVSFSLIYCLFFQTNRYNKTADRAVCITDKFIYKLDPKKKFKEMKTAGIPLADVSSHLWIIIERHLTAIIQPTALP